MIDVINDVKSDVSKVINNFKLCWLCKRILMTCLHSFLAATIVLQLINNDVKQYLHDFKYTFVSLIVAWSVHLYVYTTIITHVFGVQCNMPGHIRTTRQRSYYEGRRNKSTLHI